jgi:hypothetical protein
MDLHEFMRIYNNFYVFLREGEYTIVSPTAAGEEKGSQHPRVCRGRQWGAGARRRRDLGCVEGGSGEPGRDNSGILGAWGVGARRRRDLGCVEGGSGEPGRYGGRRCWGEENLIRIIIDIFGTILYIN